jgi:hypothetical protein
MADQFGLRFRLSRKSQGSFTCRKAAVWDRQLYFPSEGRHDVDFFRSKNPTASAGFEGTVPTGLNTHLFVTGADAVEVDGDFVEKYGMESNHHSS